MKELDQLNLPEDIRYAATHEWARVEEDLVVVGISDYAQDQLGDVVYVELPEVGSQLTKGDEFGTVESVKAVSELYAPVSGDVVSINEGLADNPGLIGEAPYLDGWMVKIKPGDLSELDSLMSQKEYLDGLKGG